MNLGLSHRTVHQSACTPTCRSAAQRPASAWLRLLTRSGLVACGALLLSAVTPRASAFIIPLGVDWRIEIHPWGHGNPDDPFDISTSIDDFFFFSNDHLMGSLTQSGIGQGGFHGGAYAFADTGPEVGADDGWVRLTTVYGIDMNPSCPVLMLTGFDAAAPQMIPVSGETFFTRSGTQYSSSSVQVVPLSQLATVLPGHNLSPFAGGDPSSVLYVFRTFAPLNELLTYQLGGSGWAYPTQAAVGGSALLTITAYPASFPTSTGITVSADLSPIGGSSAQAFYDDGTHGDMTAGDNIFSYAATISGGSAPGAQLSFTLQDAQGRTDTGMLPIAIVGCGSPDFNGDGDIGTDADIQAFFACLSGSCCPACGSADFNGDGDTGTDADIDAFFRVLAGGAC
jgi:hypothetical protein